MTLSRVLVLILSAMLLLILLGTFLISVHNSRRFLEGQLFSHAQDTATSLGLSLSTAMGTGDDAGARSMVDAIADRGYYREIIVRWTDGSRPIERRSDLRVKAVPAWFVSLVPLETPQGRSVVMSGWRQCGEVSVASHPGYAYAQLWHNFLGILEWMAGAWIAGTAVTMAMLHLVLAPLRAVESQALAVSNRDFVVMEKLPRIRELRRVVAAMNRMTTKLRTVFQDQAAFIENLRQEAYQDSVTGLSNRRQFESRLKVMAESSETVSRGLLLLIHVADFGAYNQRQGHARGDALLQEIADALTESSASADGEAALARLNGAEFALLVPGAGSENADAIAKNLMTRLRRIVPQGLDRPLSCHLGISAFTGCETASQMLTQADTALRMAKASGPAAWQVFSETVCRKSHLPTQTRMRELLCQRIDNDDIELNLLPSADVAGIRLIHLEALARIRGEDGRFLPALAFIHLVEQMAYAPALDRAVVKTVLRQMALPSRTGVDFAVNLSPASLQDKTFVDWLERTLRVVPDRAGRLTFEMSEPACVSALEALTPVIERLSSTGCAFALDHFGAGSAAFGYLIHLKPAYLKIDGTYIRRIADHRDDQFFVRALCNIAHSLDIRIIACHLERHQDLEVIRNLGVDGVQGRHIRSP